MESQSLASRIEQVQFLLKSKWDEIAYHDRKGNELREVVTLLNAELNQLLNQYKKQKSNVNSEIL